MAKTKRTGPAKAGRRKAPAKAGAHNTSPTDRARGRWLSKFKKKK